MNPASNVVLVGPMGAGKSSIGRRLAEHFGLQFVDADREIEARTGATVTTIFECEGEPGFRTRECAAMAELLARDGCLVASGGGAVLDAGTRELMRARSFVVHLHVDVAQQVARLARDRSRPLLVGDDRDSRLEKLAIERRPLYDTVADLRFDTTPWSPADAARVLADVLEGSWQRTHVHGAGETTGSGDAAASPAQVVAVGGDAAASPAQVVAVDGVQPYAITIAPGLLDDGDALARHVRGRHVLLVSDGHVAPLYAARVVAALQRARPGLQLATCVLPPGEQDKTFAAFATVIDALAALGATRDACVMALGGGVVGDVAGFAAACWMRGVDCVQLPTSLLAMVDSAVGGKTAVDLPQGKNLVGAFHSPRAVMADLATLATLPPRELRAGFAEVIKYGAIIDAPFLGWLDDRHRALLAHDAGATAAAIARSCTHKAAIVARDPHEHGERALLNFGHTFGHAIESAQGYSGSGDGLNHGEAVAVGMVLAARLSAALGMATLDDADALAALLQRFGLPVGLPTGLDADDLVARMQLDKKASADGLRFVLWNGPGKARLVPGVSRDAVRAVLVHPTHVVPR